MDAAEKDHEAERTLIHIDGLFVGQLSADELEAFTRLERLGKAYRSYEGVAGFMGLARVRSVHRPVAGEA